MMKRALLCGALMLLLLIRPCLVQGRGGGGCVEEGTLIATPLGDVPVQGLSAGDPVLAVQRGEVCRAVVLSHLRIETGEYLECLMEGRTLRVTSRHPIQVASGVFRLPASLRSGDTVWASNGEGVQNTPIHSVRRVKSTMPAYDLLVSSPGTYIANGLVVHNKGCFLPDTPLLKPDGRPVSLAEVSPGDRLLAFTHEGVPVETRVRRIVTGEAEGYCVVTTERASLKVTKDHPFYVGNDTFRTLEALRPGDSVLAYDGHGLSSQKILSIEEIRRPTRVYNLQTDAPYTFFAAGIAVHNKGGSGGGFRSSSRSSSGSGRSGGGSAGDPVGAFIGFGILLIIVVVAVSQRRKTSGELDHVYSASQVKGKAEKTKKLLEFIASTDPGFDPESLEQTARHTFLKLQECWQARDYGPMKPLLMPDLHAQHEAQIQGMIRNQEINLLEGLSLERIDLVHVRYTEKEGQREFAALVTARASDYYVDDRTRTFLRGDRAPARFQEFWTFQRQGDEWLLREIEQTQESDILKDENFFEPFTEQGLQRIYGDAGKEGGPMGPGLEKDVRQKATRVERLLHFLSRTDHKLWNQQLMKEQARRVFMNVTLARESGDPSAIREEDLYPELAASLRSNIGAQQSSGIRLEYRNLCIRKVELVLVRNYADDRKDEFTARITAHAQKILRKADRIAKQDEFVTAFEEYWVFGLLDGRWKLKEVLFPARAGRLILQENLDEDSSPEQLEWYYKQPRAT